MHYHELKQYLEFIVNKKKDNMKQTENFCTRTDRNLKKKFIIKITNSASFFNNKFFLKIPVGLSAKFFMFFSFMRFFIDSEL